MRARSTSGGSASRIAVVSQQRLARTVAVAALVQHHRLQVVSARLAGRLAEQVFQVRVSLIQAAEIDQQACAADTRLDDPGIDSQRVIVGGKRGGDISVGMGDRGFARPHGGIVGRERQGLLDQLLGIRSLAFLGEQVRLRQYGGNVSRIGRACAPVRLRRLLELAEHLERMAAQHQQFGPLCLGGRCIRQEPIEQIPVLPLFVQRLGQRNRYLRAADTQLQRLLQRRLCRGRVRFAQMCLSEQNLRRHQLGVFLQRILELDDGAFEVVALKARQGVFVIRGSLVVGATRRGREAKHDCENQMMRSDLHRHLLLSAPGIGKRHNRESRRAARSALPDPVEPLHVRWQGGRNSSKSSCCPRTAWQFPRGNCHQ
jgi:hypothetical protein